MRTTRSHALRVGLLLASAWPLVADGEKRASPHEQTTVTIAGKKITIDYGRPYKKGRTIFGDLVPLGTVWRTGADEATVLTTEADLTIGDVQVPKGSYALFTIPGEKGWTLVVNKVVKQWGAFSYDKQHDLARTAMKAAPSAAPIEQFTIALEGTGGSHGVLKMSWDTTVASVVLGVR